ncbi:MAG: hypothetical protein ACRELB_07685, partial [Polyangiaceae bacterium]
MADREATALQPLLDRLRALLDGPTAPHTRHAIGSLVHAVKSAPDAYGTGAVARLAVATGEDLPTLYRHAAVAARWSLGEVEALTGGEPRLSWSHLVQLASVECP